MHRRILIFLLGLPILLGIALWQLEIKTDISAFFIAGKSAQTQLIASNLQTGELSRRYLLSIGQNAASDDKDAFMLDWQKELAKLNGIAHVWGDNISDEELKSLISYYLPYRHMLFALEPEKEIPASLSEAALAGKAREIRHALIGPEGLWLKSILASDPMFTIEGWFKRLQTNQKTKADDSDYSPLVIETIAPGLDTDSQIPIRSAIEASFDRMNSKYDNKFSIEMTGVPVFAMAVQQQVEQDVQRVSSISMILMLTLFVLLFRSVMALLSVFLTLIAAAAVATLLTTLAFGEIHALTLALGTTLIGICVDYPIHTMVHAGSGAESPLHATRRIWPSLFLGAATTIIGYAALSFSGYPGLQQIALFSGAGIITSLLMARFILPMAIVDFKASIQPRFNLSAWLNIAGRSSLKVPLIILASIIASTGLMDMHWQDDLNQLSPSLEKLKSQDQTIRSRMHSIEPGRFILIHADTMEQALQTNESVLRKLEGLKRNHQLDACYSLFPWIASEHLQRMNHLAFRKHLNEEKRLLWKASIEKAGLKSSWFKEPGIADIQPLTLAKVLDSPARRFIAGQFLDTDEEVILTIWLGKHRPEALKQAINGIGNAAYVSQKDTINELNASYRNKAIKALGYGGLVIMLLLAFRYRSIIIALYALSPAIVSVAIVMGCWGLSGLSLSMLHLIGMLLAVAICVDYGIFFIENRANNIQITYQAIVASALTTISAFSCLGLAENPALQALAWTISPGVFLGFILCPFLIRPAIAGLPSHRSNP